MRGYLLVKIVSDKTYVNKLSSVNKILDKLQFCFTDCEFEWYFSQVHKFVRIMVLYVTNM